MLPDIPILQPQQRYLLKGKFFDYFRNRILRMVPIAGRGVDVTEEKTGMRISLADAATGTSALDFAASLAGSTVSVRAGKVLHTDWTGFDANDPQCVEWTVEAFTVAADTLTLADGASVFLKLTIAATTVDSTGPLSATGSASVTVKGGGGGAGGGGGSGAGGGGETSSDGANGTAGNAGGSVTPGIGGTGGAGGIGGTGGSVTPTGDGNVGGTGGAGEDGEAGKAVPIYNYANTKVKIRRWRATAGEFVTDTAQPAGSDTTAYIRICERDGSTLIQHQIGCVTLNLPVVSFVSST